ncbi:hypothetical protein D9758_007722 [Tetrapyrgos nigripes]|uniref:Uncharacterized protein n=1 Tax=Tetrapyrgos nigripes TaxID=182062 RepID=A0A8H5LII6_9AGAR|nr:hypothetical protein D9758_007722 [Tetrapyrgos nigripes]
MFQNPIQPSGSNSTSYLMIGGSTSTFASRTRKIIPQTAFTGAPLGAQPGQPFILFDYAGGHSRQGVSVRDVCGRTSTLDEWLAGAKDPVLAKSGLRKINSQIRWPGLETIEPWIRSVDVCFPTGHITRAQLAFSVARQIIAFAERAQFHKHRTSFPLGREGIKIESLVLVALINVGGETWQAVIAYDPQLA